MWDAFKWSSARMMRHLPAFITSIGLVTPEHTRSGDQYEGWAYAARTSDKTSSLPTSKKGHPRRSCAARNSKAAIVPTRSNRATAHG